MPSCWTELSGLSILAHQMLCKIHRLHSPSAPRCSPPKTAQGRSPSGFWSGSRSGCNANQCIQMVLKNFIQVYRVLYCRSGLHMVGVGNQASSPSSKNTLRTICTSTKVEIFLMVPGHPGTTPSYAPAAALITVEEDHNCCTRKQLPVSKSNRGE